MSFSELERVLALEDEARLLRRDLYDERDQRRLLEELLMRAAERLDQAENEIRDAHEQVALLEKAVQVLERRQER
jgi:uncharacterized protein YhaN